MDFSDLDVSSHESPNEVIENISMPSVVSGFLNDSNFTENLSVISDLNFSKTFDISDTLDWTENALTEFSVSRTLESKNFNSSLSDKIHRFKNLCNEVNRSKLKCSKTKLIVDTMDQVFNESSSLPSDLREKCADELRYCKLRNTLDSNREILTKINVDALTEKLHLSKLETNIVRDVIRNSLVAKCSELKSDKELISDILNYRSNSVLLPRSILTEEEGLVLNQIAELAANIESCSEEVKSIVNSIEQVYAIRVQKFRPLHKLEVEGLETKTKSIGLQIKNLNYMIENSIIQQHDKIAEAVDILHKELCVALDEAEYALQKARTVKESYESLRGTEFDEILREFKELRESFKHKSWALKQIKNT